MKKISKIISISILLMLTSSFLINVNAENGSTYYNQKKQEVKQEQIKNAEKIDPFIWLDDNVY